jgi:hypothetical protein
MFQRKKLLAGVTVALLLVGGMAWAASGGDVVSAQVETNDSTVVPIDGVGQVTLEELEAGLSITSAVPVEGWTATVTRSLGTQVEVRFDSDTEGRVDLTATLGGDGITVDIRRELAAETSTSTSRVTSTTVRPTTSSTVDRSTTSTLDDGGTTSTSLDDGGTTSTSLDDDGTTSTSLDDDGTTSTSLDDDGTTSTSLDDGGSTSTSLDDDPLVEDGVRTFVVEGAGTVTIEVRSGALVLLSVDVSAGWAAEIDKQESDEIRIEFESSGDAEAELRVELGSGGLEVETRSD